MGETNSPSGERLMWKGTGHVANSGWTMRRERTTWTEEGRCMEDTWQHGKGKKGDYMKEDGPTPG